MSPGDTFLKKVIWEGSEIIVLVTMIILILFLLDCIYIGLFKGAKRADIIMAKLAKEELRK